MFDEQYAIAFDVDRGNKGLLGKALLKRDALIGTTRELVIVLKHPDIQSSWVWPVIQCELKAVESAMRNAKLTETD